jgi:multidrug efflux pump subunit AcrB
MDLAKAEVRDRIERARPKLPTACARSASSRGPTDMPVMFFAILHPGDSTRTDFLIDTVIQRRLEASTESASSRSGACSTTRAHPARRGPRARGEPRPRRPDPRLSRDNFALPLGEVTDGGRRVLLRSDMRFKTHEEIENYPIGNGLAIGTSAA